MATASRTSIQLVTYEPRTLLCDGRGLAYSDARVVQHLKRMALVAALTGDSDQNLRALERRVAMQHDAVVAPGDAVADVKKTLFVAPERWLHLTTDLTAEPWTDLLKAAGVRIGCVPRTGISDPMALDAAVSAGAVSLFSDLWQVAAHLEAVNGAPIRYAVRARAATPDAHARFLHWMRYEHGADLLAVKGCLRFDIMGVEALTAQCEYLFTNQAALDEYLAGAATRLRARGRELFPEGEVAFERATATYLGGFGGRERRHFN